MRLFVTGAAGMLGRDVMAQAAQRGHEALGRTHAQLDITDTQHVLRTVGESDPDVVINCAAWTDVDGAEDHEAQATQVNATGAGQVASAALGVGAAVIHVSSDYVFDGRSSRPYREDDPPHPLSGYGRSKLAGERAVTAANPRHVIARSSWLFGLGGRNFVETMLRVGSERDAVAVVDDQVGCPTWTRHLADALLDLAERRAWGVHHVAAAGECSWHDFARQIFARSGIACQVRRQSTAQLNRPAPRPAYSVLAATRPQTPRLPSWQAGLDGYLAARAERVQAGAGR